jgi:hypothetical protein
MNTNDENHIPKILILGSRGHGQNLEEYLWNDIPDTLNVADYQTIIMDYTILNLPDVAKTAVLHNNLRDYQFAKFLFSPNSEIVIIGSPKFSFPFMQNQSWPATYWLPKYPLFDYETGDSINLIDPSFEYYMNHVETWSYCVRLDHIKSHKEIHTYLSEAGVGHKDAAITITPIAENRYKRPIAFTMSFQAGPYESGKVIWLPPTTEIFSFDAINLLLKERYNLYSENAPPEWLSKYPLPAEVPVRKRISDIYKNIADLEDEKLAQHKNLIEITVFHKLLYESGEGILEPIVRSALRALGAEVEEPRVKGQEDGRLKDPFGRDATLEIKGREGPLRLRDINELDRWVRDSLVNEDRHSKGILIGNLMRDQDLHSRENVYPDNCLKAAKNSDICLLSTAQIYKAIQDQQNGKFEQQKFWDAIFSTNGACNLPQPPEQMDNAG